MRYRFKPMLAIGSALLLLLGACSNDDQPAAPTGGADLIVVNADAYTSNPDAPRTQAFAVKDGRFIAVGSTDEIASMAGPSTEVIDAAGRTVTPGFIDGHIHLVLGLRLLTGVDLSYIPEKSKWLEIIAQKDKELPEGQWIIGGNWDYTLGEGKLPSKEDLDAVVPNRPVLLEDIDGHSAWANSKAIQLAGITANSPVPVGGQILIDPATGEPTGIFLEQAIVLFDDLPGQIPTADQTRSALVQAIKNANSYGITSVHEIATLDAAGLYQDLQENQELTLRTWFGTVGLNEGAEALVAARNDMNLRAKSMELDTLGPLFEYGFIKFYMDGVLSTHTAVLKEPYADRPDVNGVPFMSLSEMKTSIKTANDNGFSVAVHAIGDGAVSMVLDAYADVGNAPAGRPNRIEHIEVTTPDDVQRFSELGVAPVMQPNHATGTIGKYINQRLGDERENNAYVWQSMLEADANLILSSDWPTSPLDPLAHFSDAIFRESPFGLGDGTWHPEQAVSFEQTLTAYTQSAANLTPWRDQIGSITVGKWADFVVLDGKLPEPMDKSFRERSVKSTYLAGKLVYSN